jgi:hypothetical protein
MTSDAESFEQFAQSLEAFVAGHDRSRHHVAAMEGQLSEHFDDDPRFADLQYELAMFGADGHAGDAGLLTACERALEILRSDRREA